MELEGQRVETEVDKNGGENPVSILLSPCKGVVRLKVHTSSAKTLQKQDTAAGDVATGHCVAL